MRVKASLSKTPSTRMELEISELNQIMTVALSNSRSSVLRFLCPPSAILIALALVVSISTLFAAEPPRCVLIEQQGKVEIARKGSANWTSAQTNEVMQIGDRLRT